MGGPTCTHRPALLHLQFLTHSLLLQGCVSPGHWHYLHQSEWQRGCTGALGRRMSARDSVIISMATVYDSTSAAPAPPCRCLEPERPECVLGEQHSTGTFCQRWGAKGRSHPGAQQSGCHSSASRMSSCPWQAQDKAASLCALHPFPSDGTDVQTLSTASCSEQGQQEPALSSGPWGPGSSHSLCSCDSAAQGEHPEATSWSSAQQGLHGQPGA